MRLCIQTINWENGDETNFPANKCPVVEVEPDNSPNEIATQEAIIRVVRDVNKTAVWSSIVATILPD